MDDFSGAGIVWGILIIIVFAAFVFGGENARESIEDDCKNFNKMSIGEEIYGCKSIKNNPK